MKKISVCVPTYNRPHTLHQLINSFLKQDYKNKELIISDDTPNDAIKKLLSEFNNPSIKYFKNSPGLGFSQNYLQSMKRATGDYLITLGDDDIFLDKKVLSDYARIFEKNPSVGFIYSNLVQFSDQLNIEIAINYSLKNRLYKKGKESMENIWLNSIFIGGIGIRNLKNLEEIFPTKKILHPQVELIGNVINMYDSYQLAKNYIGFRSHEDQIIFRALKDKKVRQEGEHMTIELQNIFNSLNKKYNLGMDFSFAAQKLIIRQVVMMFKEKNNLGKEEMEKYYRNFCNNLTDAKKSLKLKIAFIIAKNSPSVVTTFSRSFMLCMINLKHKKEHEIFKQKLKFMISD